MIKKEEKEKKQFFKEEEKNDSIKEYQLLPILSQTSSSLFASNNDMFYMLNVKQKTYWINGSLTHV